MSKGDRDGRGFRHHKKCPELNCSFCINGRSKRPARRAQRRHGKQQTKER